MDQAGFSKLLNEYWLPASPGIILRKIFNATADENITAQEMAPLLETNPLYSQSIRSIELLKTHMAEWIAESVDPSLQDLILTERMLRLFGKGPIRNMAACVQINRRTDAGLPRKVPGKNAGKGNILKINPREQVARAIKAEEYCVDNNLVDASTAFLAGFHYDFVAALAEKNKASREIPTALDEAYKEGWDIGLAAYALASSLKQVKYAPFVFCAGILMPLGKVLMTAIFPREMGEKSWNAYAGELKKIGTLEYPASHALEKQKFGFTHLDLSADHIFFIDLLGEIAPAIRHVRDPYVLMKKHKDLYDLAVILSIGSLWTAMRRGAALKKLESALLPFQSEWLQNRKISDADLEKFLSGGKGAKK